MEHFGGFGLIYVNTKINMKGLLFLGALCLVTSCVSIRFPETMKVDIRIPENFDAEKIQVLIDTLKSQKVDAKLEFNIIPNDKND